LSWREIEHEGHGAGVQNNLDHRWLSR
jgi:hypothetical protein